MSPSELTPAEFDGAPKNRYRPRLPWARIGFVVVVAALIAGAYFWRQKVRADALRERIYELHAEAVAPVLDAIEATDLAAQEAGGITQAIGAYIVSMTHSVSDLLEVLLLAKEVGLWRLKDGVVTTPLDVVPLFETIEDLEAAAPLMASGGLKLAQSTGPRQTSNLLCLWRYKAERE